MLFSCPLLCRSDQYISWATISVCGARTSSVDGIGRTMDDVRQVFTHLWAREPACTADFHLSRSRRFSVWQTSVRSPLAGMTLHGKLLSAGDGQNTFMARPAASRHRPLHRPVRLIGGKL